MAHHTPRPLRAAGHLLRALLGLALLVALVVGVPYGLLTFGHQPTELSGGLDLLLQPDDGSLFLVVLTCLGWAAWAAFTLSAAIEIGALARRRSAPRIKGLSGLQSLAGFLIGGIVVLAPTAASAAAPTQAVAVTATQTSSTADSGTVTPSAAPSATDDSAYPQHTVTSSRETLWDLAEETLGNGQRWKDIAALNHLASGDAELRPGMVLNLPADARPTTPDPGTTAPDDAQSAGPAEHTADKPATTDRDEKPQQVTVERGDTLWSIADQHGKATDWPKLYETNKDSVQDPDRIYAGQHLDLPASMTDAEPPAKTDKPAAPHHKTTPAPTDDAHSDHDQPAATPDAPSTPAPDRTATPPAAADRSQTPTPAPSLPVDQRASSDHALAPAAIWAGAGLLAAGLLSTVATRRILQQRRRRLGRRIPMPTGTAAATEQGLRSAQHLSGFALLDAALRTLALNLADTGRDLPVLQAVVLHEGRVDLHLAEGTPPLAPFTAAAGRQDLWTCTASSPLADAEDLADADAPYPALVSLGWDPQGHLVLIDLEYAGILHLAGDPELSRHVLQAIAVELATSALPGHLEMTALGETVAGLDDAVPERVTRTANLTTAAGDLSAHTADQRRTLDSVGAPTLRAARLLDDAGGAWTPHIVLAHQLDDTAATTALYGALTERPRTAGAVITTAADTPLPDDAWTLTCHSPDEPVELPGSGLLVHLQGLADAHYADAIELLTLAASDSDVPAPEWTHAPAPAEDLDQITEGTDPAHEGLPTEYADLEQAALASPQPDDHVTQDVATPLPEQTGDPDETPGPSLAEVLTDEPDETPVTQAGPADIAVAVPPKACAAPTPPVVHATLPAPATDEAHSDTDGPSVLLLGPVTIDGATGRIDSNRLNVGTELVAYLALHPGVDHHAIDEALWPGQLSTKSKRNAVISRTRTWLGKDTDGHAHLPRVQDTGDRLYRLGPHVTCDWARFQHHARTGLNDTTEDGTLALRRALALVRGRPFAAIDPQRYAWAEPVVQEMVSAITDVAYELSTRCREADDITGALWAARQGLLAAEENELLHRALFLAHHAAGNLDALREAAARLARINDRLGGGVDMEAETAELLRNLMPKTVVRAH